MDDRAISHERMNARAANLSARHTRAAVAGPDLERSSDGYTVTVHFLPSLAYAGRVGARARVEISRDGLTVDVVEVPACEALDVFRHPASYFEGYARELTRGRLPLVGVGDAV